MAYINTVPWFSFLFVQAVDATYLIYDVAHRGHVEAARSLLPADLVLLCYTPGPISCGPPNTPVTGQPDHDFKARLFAYSSQPVPYQCRAKSKFGDVLLYIFTSGTTGMNGSVDNAGTLHACFTCMC